MMAATDVERSIMNDFFDGLRRQVRKDINFRFANKRMDNRQYFSSHVMIWKAYWL
jgi:hypothetical protein